MSALDRLISWLSPQAGLRRQRARTLLQHVRAYEGAARSDGWRVRRAGASANTDHAVDGRELRVRARSLVQNVPYATRGLEVLVSAAIGTGITPKAEGRNAKRLDALWEEHGRRIDADGLHDVYGLMGLAYRAMEQDGEVLLRRRSRRPADGLPLPYQVQVLEIDWLDDNKSGVTASGGRIVNGIEYDVLGRVTQYWLFASHPGDIVRGTASLTSSPVPARDIIHLFRASRPGQGRGITRFAPVIARIRDLMLYEDAELARKNLEARLGVLVSGNPEFLGNDSLGFPGVSAEGPRQLGDLGELPSGGVTEIPPGLNMEGIEPKAVGGYVEYCVHDLHLIAVGLGVPYESMTGDMHRVNFSSARIRQMEFRRDTEQLQWLLLVPRLCDRLWDWHCDAAVLAGKVNAADHRAEWSTPRWDYVNPQQDIGAEVEAIGVGVMTPSESLRRRGYDPAKVFAELGNDFKQLQSTGALDLMRFVMGRGQRAEAAAPQPATEEA